MSVVCVYSDFPFTAEGNKERERERKSVMTGKKSSTRTWSDNFCLHYIHNPFYSIRRESLSLSLSISRFHAALACVSVAGRDECLGGFLCSGHECNDTHEDDSKKMSGISDSNVRKLKQLLKELICDPRDT